MSWRKSSHSAFNGSCAEAAERLTASYAISGRRCLQISRGEPWLIPSGIMVRDSKNADGAILVFTSEAWREFTARVKS